MTTAPLRLGISRCLLGDEVRFDGGHKRDSFLTDVFGRYVEWVPVCPEVEARVRLEDLHACPSCRREADLGRQGDAAT